MMGEVRRYEPAGKNTSAGEMVEESHPCPQRFPSEIAALMAAVSSVVPSPFAP